MQMLAVVRCLQVLLSCRLAVQSGLSPGGQSGGAGGVLRGGWRALAHCPGHPRSRADSSTSVETAACPVSSLSSFLVGAAHMQG